MPSKRSLYLVPKTLDAPIRMLGLPLDEFVPALILGGFFFFVGKVLLCIALPIVAVVVVKLMNRGQGGSWLVNVCHWYLPKSVMVHVLRKTPPSQTREYIA